MTVQVWMSYCKSTFKLGYHLAVLGLHETTGRVLQSFLPGGQCMAMHFHKWPELLYTFSTIYSEVPAGKFYTTLEVVRSKQSLSSNLRIQTKLMQVDHLI